MDEEITNWSQLYQQQEISMTTLSVELTRVRGRDRRRYLADGLATLLVIGAAIYYLTLGTFTMVFAGVGLLLFVAASVGYFILRVGGIEGASFAAPPRPARHGPPVKTAARPAMRPASHLWPPITIASTATPAPPPVRQWRFATKTISKRRGETSCIERLSLF